ncbi:MAG: hypothetical protein R3E96_16070 [Planctomycetota bacterium]
MQSLHKHAQDALLICGQRRFLGLNQTCTTCHEDAHKGAMGDGCVVCHGQSDPWKDATGFLTIPAFVLDGVHGGLSCDQCHQTGTEFSVTARLRIRGRERVRAASATKVAAPAH